MAGGAQLGHGGVRCTAGEEEHRGERETRGIGDRGRIKVGGGCPLVGWAKEKWLASWVPAGLGQKETQKERERCLRILNSCLRILKLFGFEGT